MCVDWDRDGEAPGSRRHMGHHVQDRSVGVLGTGEGRGTRDGAEPS